MDRRGGGDGTIRVPRVLEIQLIKVCTAGRCCIKKKPAINIRIIVEGLIAFRLERREGVQIFIKFFFKVKRTLFESSILSRLKKIAFNCFL